MTGWTDGRLRATALVLIILTTGCAPDTPEEVLEVYLARVARVTGGTATLPPPRSRLPYPGHRALAVEIPDRSIDVLEFFELHGCDMGGLVGFRNSPLGRLQAASQRLGYEAAWLAAVERCGADAEDWMERLGSDKRRALPALFWNATFAAEELRTALGTGGGRAEGDLADLLRGLGDDLTGLLEGEFDLGTLESRLGRLRQASWVGPARADWQRWRRHLQAVSRLLQDALPDICRTGAPTPRAERLHRVFVLFYVKQIQPELAVRMQRDQAWVHELRHLSARLRAVQPAAYRHWHRDVVARASGSEWQRTRQAVVNHAEAWQAVLAQCSIEPAPVLGQD